MIRGSHDKVGQSAKPSKNRRRTGGRMFTLGTLGMIAMILLTACGPEVSKPYSTLSPASDTTDDIQSLYKLVFWLALIVFVGVQFAIVYSALRFRRNRPSAERPPQVHGNKRLEIAWTVIPAVVLLVILIPTITTLFDHADAAENGEIEIDVYGKQWWWEVHYGEDKNQGEDLGVVTANEIHIPEDTNVVFNLRTNNVIHSFWVPRLSGKMDLIPGHNNKISITAHEPGEYFGECAEFCGAQHAWMRFKVIVHPEDEFYSWVNSQRAGNPGTTNADAELPEGVALAPEAFSLCLSCHTVNGVVPYSVEPLEATTQRGPDLTNLACRDTLAAGMLINNRENLERWVDDPESVKPGNYMADVITPGLIRESSGDEGFNDLIDYLMSLQPAGGCVGTDAADGSPAADGSAATPVASPVASPVATPEESD
jgi:cytochrome c oxidase subunit 2